MEVGGDMYLGDTPYPLSEVQEKIRYYSALLAHEALNALHIDEVQKMPLFKNILLQTLKEGES